jgi:hypothetical protein
MNRYLIFLALTLSLSLLSCQGDDAEAQALCDCVQTDEQGRWDMNLSPDCMQRCVDQFGPQLEGMEAWFRETCGYDLQHPSVDPDQPETIET